jgi:GNAT superfamily N-acetyltransferase
VSPAFAGTQRFDPAVHDISAFDCGNDLLNRWLTRYAGQSERRDAARTFIAPGPDSSVLGYYTLLAGQLRHEAATPAVRKGQSQHFPIPIALLARLAIDKSHQGKGFGAELLRDALARVQLASAQVAVRAVVVHAIDERAAGFYERFGFRALTATPRTLMVTLSDLRAAGFCRALCENIVFLLVWLCVLCLRGRSGPVDSPSGSLDCVHASRSPSAGRALSSAL